VDRRGCDLAPVDASTTDGGRYLTSFVWPFDLDRHQRLAAALTVSREHPVAVDRASAADWLHRQLAHRPAADVLTVVWQSITQQYWPAAESARVQRIVAAARSRMPLAHLSMEGVPPQQSGGGYDVATQGPVIALDALTSASGGEASAPRRTEVWLLLSGVAAAVSSGCPLRPTEVSPRRAQEDRGIN